MKELSDKQLINCDEALHKLAVNLNVPVEIIIEIFIAAYNNKNIILPKNRFCEVIEFIKKENYF